MRRKPATPEEIDEIVRLRECGISYQQISQRVGISEGSVYYHCLKQGAEPPKPRPLPEGIVGPPEFNRGTYKVRRFTPAEDARLLELEAEGLSQYEIARRLGRKRNSINGRLMTLARREARAEGQ